MLEIPYAIPVLELAPVSMWYSFLHICIIRFVRFFAAVESQSPVRLTAQQVVKK